MGRRNSSKVRESTMTQRQLDKLLSVKQKSDRRNDGRDWTTYLYERLNGVKEGPTDDGTE
jgi:hypothetical protein